ncbi:ArnT family glycosyltransferase [Luteibacter yeojuensis]|uniref:Glycosyltransferase family 39 protein n=1 Tax=Luteibacter yeojuensis TaxID=345309 RepID=A0A7X5TPJ5_9GAMM|nr:glycosyltransferase family 39 protein [Luteibacter yeojuensis]NID15125.1 glycosyltransferase family 39 protein [Luteibacter yeojuensis]
MRVPPGLAMSMGERSSVAAHARSWRGIFLAVFVVACVVKLVIACSLSPFGDEAFYWQESLAPAWGYSDLPPLTAWLIALSEGLFGHGLLPMRLPFLILGALLPWQVGAMAARDGDEAARWQAATFVTLLPLVGSLGVLALPDVPLTFATLLALQGLLAALERNRIRDWLLLGGGLAIAWMTHYRAAMPMLGGLLFLLLTPRGRRQWRRPGFWMAMGVAALGLLPIVLYNLAAHGAGLAFQLLDRNPWQFHADALAQPLEQAVACTPLAWAAMLWAIWRAWRRRAEAPFDAIAVVAGTFVVAYFVLGLFADDLRFRAHWPLPGYLVACIALPFFLREAGTAWRRTVYAGFALAGLGLAAGLGYLGLAASTHGATVLAGMKAFPTNFTGWRESAAAVKRELDAAPDAIVVADNFMLAAELRFELGAAHTVYSLDSPLNVKHGRAPQLAAWGLDEAGLATHAGSRILLAVDESKLHDVEARRWLGSICARVDIVRPAGRVEAFDKRRSFALYEGRARPSRGQAGNPDDCVVWMSAYKAGSL